MFRDIHFYSRIWPISGDDKWVRSENIDDESTAIREKILGMCQDYYWSDILSLQTNIMSYLMFTKLEFVNIKYD